MKKMRKGFTLVELLIVIGIIGILGAMGMIGGTEATNIAKVTKIIDGFKKIEAVMTMYYADNYAVSDAGTTDIADLIAGVKAHIKDADETLTANATPVAGKYTISMVQTAGTPEKWYLAYTLDTDSVTTLGPILKTKNGSMGFKKGTTSEGTTTYSDYDGATATVYMQVH
ncbi:MAG: prepilin-type N-terminal cleavage/methylation domain-containing protein [Synergistaceae bacterium]|nr:prepilin-type N-terminal cleavage/methylation domain-containing protein [Synergistaceae bacterium]